MMCFAPSLVIHCVWLYLCYESSFEYYAGNEGIAR